MAKEPNNATIDISNLPPGIYILKVYETGSGNVYSSKFNVMK